jgi:hypothetical protein
MHQRGFEYWTTVLERPETLLVLDRALNNLTPWSRVLLEMLTVTEIIQISPAFYGTIRFSDYEFLGFVHRLAF